MIRGAVNLMPEAPAARLVELAELAESLGYQRCWVYDEGLAARDVHVTLAAIAGATEVMHLGPGITNPYTRHPAQSAMAIATLDELSGGRAFLGIGAGGSLTLGPLGLRPTRPLTAVREAITASRRLFSGETVDLAGETLSLHRASLGFGRPDIEIWLAGRGPKMLGLGGELADGVMLDFLHKDTLGDQVALIRAGAEHSGRTPRISYSTALVTDDAGLDAVRPHLTYRLVDSPPRVRDLLGLTDEEVGRIRSAMTDGLEAAARHIRDEWVMAFVIAGTPEKCRLELADLTARHGLEEFLVPVLDLDTAEDEIERSARVLQLGP